MARKREKTQLLLLIDDLNTVNGRLVVADALMRQQKQPHAIAQKQAALQELEDIRDTIGIQIKNLRADLLPR